jgi:hypothetical protein
VRSIEDGVAFLEQPADRLDDADGIIPQATWLAFQRLGAAMAIGHPLRSGPITAVDGSGHMNNAAACFTTVPPHIHADR